MLSSHLTSAVDRYLPAVVDLAQQIARIPAPTGHEEQRAAFVQHSYKERGCQPWTDDVGNVYLRRLGTGSGAILVAAHLDTVFPIDTDLAVRREADQLHGPGIGDNSLAVATLLLLPEILNDAGIATVPAVLLCADVGEEGLGNLRGMRRAVELHRAELVAALALEGVGLGRVTNRAVGSRRLRMVIHGPGGHSWRAFGNPSAIHVLGEMIAAITALEVPEAPRTTFNVGAVEGGVSINTIAPQAAFSLDLRSVDAAALADLAQQVDEIVQRAADPATGVTVHCELLGDRPAGSIPDDAPIVRAAFEALREVGVEPEYDDASTDANVPIAAGIPSVCIGLTTGGNGHRVDEYIDLPPLRQGLLQTVRLLQFLGEGGG